MLYRTPLLLHEDGERLPMLVGPNGLPVIEPNVFALTQRGLAWRTITKKLRAIGKLHAWADQNVINLNERIHSGKLFSESEINGSLLSTLRRSSLQKKIQKLTVNAKSFNIIVMHVHEYLAWRFSSQIVKIATTDQRFEAIKHKQQIVLGWLIDAFLSVSSAQNEVNKGLSIEQLNRLIELTFLTSAENPWKSEAIRHRNHLIIQLLLNFGVRPAELLTLRVEDVQIGAISVGTQIKLPELCN